MAARTGAPLSCGAWLACLTLSPHQSPQDGAGGGRTSSSNAVTQASTLLHHGKLKRGMWRLMRCLRDLGMAHTFHTAVPHMATSQCPIECNMPKPKDMTWDCRNCGIVQNCRVTWGHIGQGVQTRSKARPARPNSIRQHRRGIIQQLDAFG